MTWFKVDDGLFSSRKVLMIPRPFRNECLGAWVQAGAWSSKELTDGHVPAFVLEELGGIPEVRDELIRVGLWLADGDGGIHFHDWCDYQPTKEKVMDERSKAVDRMNRARSFKQGATPERSSGEVRANSGRSDDNPTRPDPTIPKGIEGRATRITPSFEISKAMTDWAAAKSINLDLEAETEKFINYYLAEAGAKGIKLDWVATWRNWIVRAQGWAKENNRDIDPWAGKEHLGFAS